MTTTLDREKIVKKIEKNKEAAERRRNEMPEPKNRQILQKDREDAVLMASLNSDSLIVKYIRKEPFLTRIATTGRKQYKFNRGNPYGVMVAFRKEPEDKFLVGWSKIHPTAENLDFTKFRAKYVAILRALKDDINFNIKYTKDGLRKVSATTADGTSVPVDVAKNLDIFVDRVKKYINKDASNNKTADNVHYKST